MTIRGGGDPRQAWLHAVLENGPAPRSFAADAHDCIMVQALPDLPNTSVWRALARTTASSPRIEDQA